MLKHLCTHDVSLVLLKELSLNDYVTKELEKVATELNLGILYLQTSRD